MKRNMTYRKNRFLKQESCRDQAMMLSLIEDYTDKKLTGKRPDRRAYVARCLGNEKKTFTASLNMVTSLLLDRERAGRERKRNRFMKEMERKKEILLKSILSKNSRNDQNPLVR